MTIGYSIVPALRLVFIRAWGVLTYDQLRGLAEALAGEAAFQPDFRAMADLRQVTEIAISSPQVTGGIPSAFAPSARRAVIAAPSEAFGMTRMYQLTAGLKSESLRLFPALPPALEWLGLTSGTRWPEPFPDRTIGD